MSPGAMSPATRALRCGACACKRWLFRWLPVFGGSECCETPCKVRILGAGLARYFPLCRALVSHGSACQAVRRCVFCRLNLRPWRAWRAPRTVGERTPCRYQPTRSSAATPTSSDAWSEGLKGARTFEASPCFKRRLQCRAEQQEVP